MKKLSFLAAVASAMVSMAAGCVHTVTADVCVYGATPGGIAAAVTAARAGKRVVLVVPEREIGGMSSSGLGATDFGRKEAIGGISREFYARVGKKYGGEAAWYFEPHVARAAFEELIREAKVEVRWGEFVHSLDRQDERIAAMRTADWPPQRDDRPVETVYRAKVFIDATYEGDLMAAAGVTCTVGRESNAKYGETLNGVRGETPKHQFTVAVDPYVVPGDPASGLIPLVEPDDGSKPGDGDRRVQAYNFRLCLTKDPKNRREITPPFAYDPGRYELLARYLEAYQKEKGQPPRLGELLSIIEVPGGKTDVNNNGPISTDVIGASGGWAEASPAGRQKIRQEHEDYTRGLLHFLASSPRVPSSLREEMSTWGLAADEFNTGWPHQLYVREARRMVSDYVMTEKDCAGATRAPDSVGLGSYGMDSHNCRRVAQWDLVAKKGRVENEGDVQAPVPAPYPISYRSIVPKRGECRNLLVPVCLSATHIAYGSIRMEPVFMVLGQSAGEAAALAIDAGCDVQAVDYGKLRERLLAHGQVLELK